MSDLKILSPENIFINAKCSTKPVMPFNPEGYSQSARAAHKKISKQHRRDVGGASLAVSPPPEVPSSR